MSCAKVRSEITIHECPQPKSSKRRQISLGLADDFQQYSALSTSSCIHQIHSLFPPPLPKIQRYKKSKTLSPPRAETNQLTPLRPLLRHLPVLLLLLLLQELALLLGAHLAQPAVALLLLELLGRDAALLGLLLVVQLAQLARLLLARRAHLAQRFGPEVRGADEVVGQAQEGREQRGRGGLGVQAHGEVDAFAGDEVVESVGGGSVKGSGVFGAWWDVCTSWAHRWAGR